MTLLARLAGAITIAIGCGTGGYFLGKNQNSASQTFESPAQTIEGRSQTPTRPIPTHLDAKALRASLDAETNPLARFKLALQHLEDWVAKSPEDALAWLVTQQVSDRRDNVIRMALNQYSENDAKGAADWAMKNLTGNDLNNTLIAIAENWAAENGSEAAAWFLTLPATAERDAAMENILFNWASNEPAAALAFLKANPAVAELAPTLRRAALAGWAKSDPNGAVAASYTLSQANNDPEQFANTVANWATVDLEASSSWLITNLPAGVERTAAAQELATIFAQQSPAAGVTWLGKLAAGTERDLAAGALAATWSRVSPAEAAKWAMTQESSTIAPEALATISQNFFMKNPKDFEAWRATLPPGPMKDQAAQVGAMSGDE